MPARALRHRAGLTIASVHGHAGPESRDLLGIPRRLRPGAASPFEQRRARCVEQAQARRWSATGLLEGRQARRCRIRRIGVADAAQHVRIGLARLSVWFSWRARRKRLLIASSPRGPRDRSPARPSVSTCSDARRVEPASVRISVRARNRGRRPTRPARPCPDLPAESPGVIRWITRYTSPSSANTRSSPFARGPRPAAFGCRDWSVHRPKEKRRRETKALDPAIDDTRLQRVEIQENVGQFRHAGATTLSPQCRARSLSENVVLARHPGLLSVVDGWTTTRRDQPARR